MHKMGVAGLGEDLSAQGLADQPVFLWALFAILPMAMIYIALLLSPELAVAWLAKDAEGAGAVEWGTVLILLPAILVGAIILVAYRARLPSRRLVWWAAFWTFGATYFAGEEIGWGQQIFHWKTPDWLAAINKHQETGLHNVSSWFHQKPRFLVEMWILIGGLIMPILRMISGDDRRARVDDPLTWFWATRVCIVPAAMVALVRIFDTIEDASIDGAQGLISDALGASELHEFYVAIFIAVYLLSLWTRLKYRSDTTST